MVFSGAALIPSLFNASPAGAAVPASPWLGEVGQVGAVGAASALGAPGTAAHQPVGLARTPSGHGYWVAAADGGVFSFGDATFHGSMGGRTLNSPIVGITATPSGHGYWLAAADGGVFSFGDATFYGSMGAHPLNSPIVAAAATPSGRGYWLAAADGGVFSFGVAAFHGSLAGTGTGTHVTSITASDTGSGYWLTDAQGGIHAFGDARPVASPPAAPAATPVVAAAATPSGTGYWELTGTPPAPPGPVVGASLGSFVVTCYDLPGITASGAPVGMNVVATDPRVIPLGTTIWIDGVGQRTALDTGGAIKGNRLDVWMPTYSQCVNWGVQTRAVNLVTPQAS